MEPRTLTLAVTIAAIAIVAIGVGYAYTATVSVDDNDVGATFITVTPENDDSSVTAAAFTKSLSDFNIVYNTETVYSGNSAKQIYTLNTADSTATRSYYHTTAGAFALSAVNNASIPAEGDTAIYYIGTQKVKVESNTGSIPAFDFTVSKTDGTFGAGYSFFIAVVDDGKANTVGNEIKWFGTKDDVNTVTFSKTAVSSSSKEYVVDLYVEFTDALTDTAPVKDIMKDVKFEYKAEVNVTHTYNYTYYDWGSGDAYVAKGNGGTNITTFVLAQPTAAQTAGGFVGWKVFTTLPALTTKLTGASTDEGVLAAGSTYTFTSTNPIYIFAVYSA